MPGDLTDVIAGALADAREEGVLDENTEGVTETPEEGVTPEGEETPEGAEGTEAVEEPAAKEGEEGEEEAEGEDEAKEEEEEDDLATEIGPAKDKHGRENRIPHSRVVKIVENQVGKRLAPVIAGIAKDFGLDVAKITPKNFYDTIKGVVEPLRAKVSNMDALEPIIANRPDDFIRILAHNDPQYAKFLAVLNEGYTPPVAKEEKDDPMPAPDFDLGNGQKTYSIEGLKARDEWVERKVLRVVDKRFKPIEDERTAVQKIQQDRETLQRETKALLDDAATWTGFMDNQEAIKAEMAKIDRKVPFQTALRRAYDTVVVKGLQTKATKARDAALAELKKAPRKTSISSGASTPKRVKEPIRGEDGEVITGTEAVIREALATARAEGRVR